MGLKNGIVTTNYKLIKFIETMYKHKKEPKVKIWITISDEVKREQEEWRNNLKKRVSEWMSKIDKKYLI